MTFYLSKRAQLDLTKMFPIGTFGSFSKDQGWSVIAYKPDHIEAVISLGQDPTHMGLDIRRYVDEFFIDISNRPEWLPEKMKAEEFIALVPKIHELIGQIAHKAELIQTPSEKLLDRMFPPLLFYGWADRFFTPTSLYMERLVAFLSVRNKEFQSTFVADLTSDIAEISGSIRWPLQFGLFGTRPSLVKTYHIYRFRFPADDNQEIQKIRDLIQKLGQAAQEKNIGRKEEE